jgi:hypothetical protein
MLAAGGAARAVSPVFFLEADAGTYPILICVLEAGAASAPLHGNKHWAGVAAFTINGEHRFGEGAHALFAIEMDVVFAINMFHDRYLLFE